MTVAWRIVRSDLARYAFDGEGAFLYGGRWNNVGTRMVYLAESKALAAMEVLVHVDLNLLSIPYSAIAVEFDESACTNLAKLPDGLDVWGGIPGVIARQIGDEWVEKQSSLLLRAPSVVIPGEFNYLLNPTHPDIASLRILKPEPFIFDSRIRD